MVRRSAVLTAVITFAAGVIAHAALVTVSVDVDGEIPSASDRTNDARHKLYEAALMSGESGIVERFQCIEVDEYSLNRRLVVTDAGEYCVSADGSITPPSSLKPSDPFRHLMKEHPKWVLHNMDFVATVANAERAKAYLRQHTEY
jgi:hypothetical protein